MSSEILASRLEELAKFFPLLIPTARKLNAHSLAWLIAGSGCLYVYGNERQPQDLDFYLTAASHDRADQIFTIPSYPYSSPVEKVRNSNPHGDHSLQFTSQLQITNQGKIYDLAPTELVLAHRGQIEYDQEIIYFAPVEEVLLVKVLLGRGPEAGKHDLEDVRNFLKIGPQIDESYLAARQAELGLDHDLFVKVR